MYAIFYFIVVATFFHKSTCNRARRSNDLTSPDKQIVYMKDLKKALDELEKKLLLNVSSNEGIKDGKYCNNQQETKNEIPLTSKISLDNPTLLNIFNTLKKNGPLKKDSKPSDEDLSWLKIKLLV
ncbi:uncharacterized protein LOC123873775 isoform X1 [Maniola jurtina]|uniref:uncharacterized protein LOC123873775 isoform X1 n=1 Tax=Maniola jurtina TaxID=191418 RepID=UPI001E68970A|nr:uncharacterized protein LOC123873775 isoform X1 [Maniola jurtina]